MCVLSIYIYIDNVSITLTVFRQKNGKTKQKRHGSLVNTEVVPIFKKYSNYLR